ncbi:hypothetical protein Forpe1208_v008364 [Fusarium oxysporum f. sp. rapae]|uniref:Uncharacterized protein n=1 Tax=Fusarium oxysporum f. sp. rapae TaxID=485398 RepID=A0A8J5TTU5_FUSOX|nr:hypothetical protein Forpe1208_v008364 [Fusarium oxysporum f. sp. rapae]
MKFSLILCAIIPLVYGCNGPREVGSNANCLGGTYTDCAAEKQSLCTLECFNQPPGQCTTGCTTRAQQECQRDCMAINNCDDCIDHLLIMGGAESAALEACSQPGDSYYCNCG